MTILIPIQQVQEMINQLVALQEDVTAQYQAYQTALMSYMEYQWWLTLQAVCGEERVLREAPQSIGALLLHEIPRHQSYVQDKIPQWQFLREIPQHMLTQVQVQDTQSQFQGELTPSSQAVQLMCHYLPLN